MGIRRFDKTEKGGSGDTQAWGGDGVVIGNQTDQEIPICVSQALGFL